MVLGRGVISNIRLRSNIFSVRIQPLVNERRQRSKNNNHGWYGY